MKKHLLILASLAISVWTASGREYFFNGGFETDSFDGIKITSSDAVLVNTSSGRSLFIGKVVGGLEIQPAENSIFSGENVKESKVLPHCTFELKLDPKATCNLSFDYMPGNIRNGGGFIITDSKGKVLRQRVLPVNNLDWNNYQIPFKFHPESDGRIFLKFFIKSAADLGGMALDNISIRLHGDLLPRWGSGNILIGNGDLPGWFWKVSDSNSIKCNGDGFTLQTTSDETVTVEVKTPELMPEKEYCLRLGGNADKIMSAVAEIKFIDSRQQIIGKSAVFTLKNSAGKYFRKDWRFSLPEGTMLVQLNVKYRFAADTSASIDTPRIFLAPKLKK